MLREHSPPFIAARITKGQDDCGDHEWYKHQEQTWRCYHCEPAVTHTVPWDARELRARQFEAGASMIRAGVRAPESHGLPHQ